MKVSLKSWLDSLLVRFDKESLIALSDLAKLPPGLRCVTILMAKSKTMERIVTS